MPPQIQGSVKLPQLRHRRHCRALHCLCPSVQQPMSQWPALATLYTEVLQCVTVCTVCCSVLQCVPTTQGKKRRLEHFTVPCPHKFHLRGSSLLSDFLPFYNLSFASFEKLVSSQFLAHPYFSPPTALILIILKLILTSQSQ